MVVSSLTYEQASATGTGANLKAGIWSCAPDPTAVSTNTAFGGNSTWIATYIFFTNTDANLTVLPGANLTLVNGMEGKETWNFDTSGGNNGKLTIQSGGTLNIGPTETSSVNPYFTSGAYTQASVNFGVNSPVTPQNGVLTIEPQGVLNIAENANVTMNQSSVLNNSGTINVISSSE